MKVIIACLLVAAACAAPNVEVKRSETGNDVAATCDTVACKRSCSAFGWIGGKCFSGSCLCYRFKNYLQVQKISNQIENDELSARDECTQLACDTWCHSMGKMRGSCVGDRCFCF